MHGASPRDCQDMYWMFKERTWRVGAGGKWLGGRGGDEHDSFMGSQWRWRDENE